jgi:hypothetical protein
VLLLNESLLLLLFLLFISLSTPSGNFWIRPRISCKIFKGRNHLEDLVRDTRIILILNLNKLGASV